MIEKSRGKRYEFVMDITAILDYDPVGEITESRNRNTNISKPGTAPIAADVAGSVGQMEEPRGTTEGCRGTGKGYCDIGEGFLAAFEAAGKVLWCTEGEFGGKER